MGYHLYMAENPKIQKLISRLTADEKIRLLNGVGSWKTFQADGKLPQLIMSDGPHGLRKQGDELFSDINKSLIATCFPTASCAASSWNKEALFLLGKSIALEAKKENVDIVLGPGINIKRSPLCGRNFEYYSEDPYLAGKLAAADINGMQENGTACSLKHFAANNQETRRQTSNSIIDERTLHEIYLRAFEIAVKEAAPATIMCSYNRLNGEYVCRNKKLLNDILRNKWGFKGFVVSDWGACLNQALCIKAGLDLAMPDSHDYLPKQLKESFDAGDISIQEIEKAAGRIIELALKKEEEKTSENNKKHTLDYKIQHETALKIAEESAVLLKNENDFLPLAKGKIAVIGELAEFVKFQGGGSSHINTKRYPDAIESLAEAGYEIFYSKGYYSGFCKKSKLKKINGQLMEEAVTLAHYAAINNMPVLFFCGLTDAYEGEGFDRKTLDFPEEQIELLEKVLALTDNVALVTFSGAPVVFPFKNKVKSILHMYLCGEACGEAAASLISGKTNPSGHLAETFPVKTEDMPCFNNFGSIEKDNVEYREGIFVGYRYFETKDIPVQYEFGYGLSYTSFELSDMKVELPKVICKVKNTGNRAGSEVVQLYVKNPEGQISKENPIRPKKELRGFEKVFLNPGESRSVEIIIDDNAFCIYSVKTEKFVKIEGEYELQLASSVKNVHLSQKVQIKGEKLEDHIVPVSDDFYKAHSIKPHKPGEFTVSDNLMDLAEYSLRVKIVHKIILAITKLTCKGESEDDPAIKIALSAMSENPLESLISTSGGAISEKLVKRLVKWANGKKR